MDDRSELHWRYLKDNLDHSRHHESIRTTTTNIILVIAGAGLAIVGYDKCIDVNDLPTLIFLVMLGLFGSVFSAKQTERASLHYARARALRDALDSGPHDPDFKGLKVVADKKHNSKYPWLSAQELRSFWILLHLSVSALAAVLIIIAICAGKCSP